MEHFGKSLYVDDPQYVPAIHFQNHRVPSDMACYACHADYTIYGPLKDKLQGLKADLRAIRQHAALMDSLKSNEMSCVTSGCHDMIHNVDALDHSCSSRSLVSL